mmetsp:Transcript_4726/g.16313  ORF Transcript_4726/g.16313 Transcript_4726/m.16313 type:complete len:197 (-) Transcript_4726:127-717(-)
MELGGDVVECLREVGSLPAAEATAAARSAAATVLGEAAAAPTTASERAVDGLCVALAEAARLSLSAKALASTLEHDAGLDAKRAGAVSDAYGEKRDQLKALLARTARAGPLPRLVESSWSADLAVSSSEDAQLLKPVVHLSLRTAPAAARAESLGAGGGAAPALQEIAVALNEEQLQHMVQKLREACKAVEAHARN